MNPVERLLGAVINPVVDAVDVDGVVSKVDIDRLVNEVDLDAVLEKVDLDALLARIDVDALLDRIDVDELLARIDVDKLTDRMDVQALIDRVDVQALIGRVDINALVGQVDVNAMVDQVDVAALAQRAGIDQIVSEATRGVSARMLGHARRQIVGLDLILTGIVARLTRRPRPVPPQGATATGAVAGGVSRLLAYFVDLAVLTVAFSVTTSVIAYLVELFSGEKFQTEGTSWGWWLGTGYLVFAFLYWLIGLTIAGSSPGKAVIGLRVLSTSGRALKGRQALIRVVVYPFSFILGLGLIPIVTARSHRALHDKAARTTVRYDWGDVETVRSPLTRWLRNKPVTTTWAENELGPGAGPEPTATFDPSETATGPEVASPGADVAPLAEHEPATEPTATGPTASGAPAAPLPTRVPTPSTSIPTAVVGPPPTGPTTNGNGVTAAPEPAPRTDQ